MKLIAMMMLVLSSVCHAEQVAVIAAGQSNMLSGRGLHSAFEQRMFEHGYDVKIIPCAVGGKSILKWNRVLSGRFYYGRCIGRAIASGLPVAGMIWWQGEADTHRDDWWKDRNFVWLARYGRLVSDFRNDLGANFPVVHAILHNKRKPGWQWIRTQQREFRLPRTKGVGTDAINYRDAVHPDGFGYEEMGRRFADAMAELMEQ